MHHSCAPISEGGGGVCEIRYYEGIRFPLKLLQVTTGTGSPWVLALPQPDGVGFGLMSRAGP
jgi:hypothetical protein